MVQPGGRSTTPRLATNRRRAPESASKLLAGCSLRSLQRRGGATPDRAHPPGPAFRRASRVTQVTEPGVRRELRAPPGVGVGRRLGGVCAEARRGAGLLWGQKDFPRRYLPVEVQLVLQVLSPFRPAVIQAGPWDPVSLLALVSGSRPSTGSPALCIWELVQPPRQALMLKTKDCLANIRQQVSTPLTLAAHLPHQTNLTFKPQLKAPTVILPQLLDCDGGRKNTFANSTLFSRVSGLGLVLRGGQLC
ncbi:uncharacterized protein LOC125101171 [Lutra lutra]|uniref:uncharacterized protein LOC125101171 n=1 Tax=Lutra lutra TaxID=9657 RepID=UPI001FD208BC|nr:uncharacterized protein LOC125101171 [Lutra lutra]